METIIGFKAQTRFKFAKNKKTLGTQIILLSDGIKLYLIHLVYYAKIYKEVCLVSTIKHDSRNIMV